MRDIMSCAEARPSLVPSKLGWRDQFIRKVVHERLSGIREGRLEILDQGERYSFGDSNGLSTLSATIEIHHPRALRDTALAGTVGAGGAYIDGLWSCDDLPALFRIFLLNQDVLFGMERGWARGSQMVQSLLHSLRRNNRKGSRHNIEAHYDVGNDFFKLILDETLTYSCGIFEREDADLQEASIAKYDRACRKLQIRPEDHILEIGTGWGGFAIHAARNYGCRVTTTTISRKQYELASKRVHEAGLDDRITLLLEDYRDLEGRYDKLVSIEMIEAVGHSFYDTYFGTCSRLLKPQGMMFLQAITMADQHYEWARRSVDFIKRFIFPGSTIPSVTAICQSATRATDLRLFHLEDITAHYVTTLRRWRERLLSRKNEVRSLGYSEAFLRAWDFYFSYCEAGFQERYIGDVQMLLVKPDCRREPLVPSLM
jgi:cyclopropane-fatty-acyl-phospholipid synthase